MTTTKQVTVWYNDRPGPEAGWVARCTEYDADGSAIPGCIDMDESMDLDDRHDIDGAIRLAARHWGVDVGRVEVIGAPGA
jgi:hypothetical protein